MKIPKIFSNLVKVKGELRTTEIYKTNKSMYLLIQYNESYFDDVLEFITACGKCGILVVNQHVYEDIEDDDRDTLKANTPSRRINERYYTLINGTYTAFAKLYENINVANSILQSITKDICNSCCSTYFNKLIEDGILKGFKHNDILPKYDDSVTCEMDGKTVIYDDVDKILKRLSSSFTALDIYDMITIEYKDTIFKLSHIISEYVNNNIYVELISILKQNTNLLSYYSEDPSKDTLKYLTYPMYNRDVNSINGDKSIAEMDEIFQQDYDRFIQSTPEYMNKYTVEDIT